MTAVDTALAYVQAGISFVPVRLDGSKAPAIATWLELQERLPTREEIHCWYDRPRPLGLATIGGAVSGCLEHLDFDREADVIFWAWCDLVTQELAGIIDRLSVYSTPRGGFHVRYRCPDDDIAGNMKLAIDPDAPANDRVLIETRGEGGYAIAPGSPAECHETGKEYKHLTGPFIPPTISVAEHEVLIRCARSFNREVKTFPKQVGLDLRPGDDYERRGPDWSEILEPCGWKCIAGLPAGERRWRRPGKDGPGWSATTGHCQGQDGADLLRVFSSNAAPLEDGKAYGKFRALAVLRYGGDLSAAADALARQGYGTPARKKHESNGHHEQNGFKELPRPKEPPLPLIPYQPFPLQFMPPLVSDYVAASAQAIGCDPALVGVPALAVLAGCIGNARAIHLKSRWNEPAVLWTLTIARSGSVKSPGFAAAIDPMIDEQQTRWEEFLERKAQGIEEQAPPCRVTSDATVAAIGELLRDSPRGMLLGRDELDGWFQSFSRFSQGGATDRPHWLEMHGARSLRVDRITRIKGPLSIRRACCSICGTIQFATLRGALDEAALGAGLGARFLLAMPPLLKRVWTEAEVEEDLYDRYARLLVALERLSMRDETKRRPYSLHLGAAAKALWIDWFNRWGVRQAEADDEAAAVLAKLEGGAARLALLWHCTAHAAAASDDLVEIGKQAIESGIALGEWFAHEAERVYDMLRESQEEKFSRELVAWIKARGGRVSVRQVSRGLHARYRTADDARNALQEIVVAGLADWLMPSCEGPKGGRPSEECVLRNDNSDRSDKSQNPVFPEEY